MFNDDPVIKINHNINDSQGDMDFLFGLWRTWRQVKDEQITFNFTGCRFLRQNAVAFLGGLVRILQANNNEVMFAVSTINANVLDNLEKSSFMHTLILDYVPPTKAGNTIPYREDFTNSDDYASYLSDKWLGRGWLNVGEKLKSQIVSAVIEAYINVFDHSNSPIGAVSCGQRYPNLHQLKLTMVDFGIGIPANVRVFLKEPSMTTVDALKWAFEPGKSTKNDGPVARGNGLKILKKFIEDNNGSLEVYSDDGYVCISRNLPVFRMRNNAFKGTLVQISLHCDENLYSIPSESDFDSSESFF